MTTRVVTKPQPPGRSVPEQVVITTAPSRPGAFTWPLRREGPAKMTGEAKYVDDLVVPGAWYGTTIRSTEAHAKLIAIEPDPNVDWSKVVLVTAADIPGVNLVSEITAEPVVSLDLDDQPVLVPVGGEIRHHAEPVALLAAADRETLRRLRGSIHLVTEPLPPVLDPEASDHVFARYDLVDGDVEVGLRAAYLVLDGEYRVGHQEQLYIENQGMIAVPEVDGSVTIHGSIQCLYYVHEVVRKVLGLPASKVRVVQAETGGGFGGKEEYPSMLAAHAALLARKCRRPVRMIYERHEDISATTKRHPAVIRHRTGVTEDGRLVAMDVQIVMDGGAYSTLSPFVLSRAVIHAGGPYRCPNVRIRAKATRTNTPPNGAFRGFGGPQVGFAIETHLSRLAESLGLSPAEIRVRNVYHVGDATPTGQILQESVAAADVLLAAVGATDFEAKRRAVRQPARERVRRLREMAERPLSSAPVRTASGIGVALGWHGTGFTGTGEVAIGSVASLELTADGRVRLLVGTTEMGQGTKTILPLLVADELGISPETVEFAPQDTADVPNTGPTVASRTAMVVGGMCIQAARRLRQTIEARNPGRSFADVRLDDTAAYGGTRIDQLFEPFTSMDFDEARMRGEAHAAFGWAACVARVDVDLDTGQVAVREAVAADDVGKVIHPVLCEGQVEGGTLQAVGYATTEEMKLQEGRYLNDRLATYLIPTALDAPTIRTILVEAPYTRLPHGAKGVGELPMNVAAPAVIGAIHDAVGVWVTELPATPERILAAIHGAPPVAAINDLTP